MDLEERIEQLQRHIDSYSEMLERSIKERKLLKDCRQPDMTQLFNGIEKFFTVQKTKGNYEHILGGDGRSKPWSENRTGLIVEVKLNEGLYLSQEQMNIVEDYVKKIHKPDHIKFIK